MKLQANTMLVSLLPCVPQGNQNDQNDHNSVPVAKRGRSDFGEMSKMTNKSNS